MKELADLENGYTRLANEILDFMAKIKFTPTQYRILFVVWRYTYGFQRKSHSLSLAFFAEATGCDVRLIQRELKKLINMKVLMESYSKGNTRELSFNKNLNEWEVAGTANGNLDNGNLVNDNLDNDYSDNGKIDNGQIDNITPGKIDRFSIGKIDNQERKYKKNIKDIYIYILEHWNEKEIVKHQPTTAMIKKIETALKKYTKEQIITAIDNYVTVYRDKEYFYSHIWRLDKFLKQSNGLPDFLEDGQQWLNYKNQKPSNKPQSKNKFHNFEGGLKYTKDELEKMLRDKSKDKKT